MADEKAFPRKENNAYALAGETFGDLTVLYKSKDQKCYKNRGVLWHCRCSCGNECDVLSTLLVTGRKTHCGCKSSPSYYYVDISGQKFNRLTALRPLPERDSKGSVIWHCRCDCGTEKDFSYNDLLYSNLRSCGCRQEEHAAKLGSFITRVDGTSLNMLKSKKVASNNTSGVRGVYFIRGKWVAKIVFQKKQYFLGAYDSLEDAAKARKLAENLLVDGISSHYERWKAKADADPQWASENPIKISVDKVNDELKVSFYPKLT